MLLIVIGWFLLGLVGSFLGLYIYYKKELDITIGDIIFHSFLGLLGPLCLISMLWVYIDEFCIWSKIRDKVIIKGRNRE